MTLCQIVKFEGILQSLPEHEAQDSTLNYSKGWLAKWNELTVISTLLLGDIAGLCLDDLLPQSSGQRTNAAEVKNIKTDEHKSPSM